MFKWKSQSLVLATRSVNIPDIPFLFGPQTWNNLHQNVSQADDLEFLPSKENWTKI